MTREEFLKEMSIAGSPEKIATLGDDVMKLIASKLDVTNRAELTNVELMLQRTLAEIRRLQRMWDKSHTI